MAALLIVDDDFDIAEGLKSTIQWGLLGVTTVWTASDAACALAHMRANKPDIVITDIRMPGMDGLELSHAIQNEFPAVKVIILSGYSDFTYAQRAMEFGVRKYLLKPVVIHELLHTVHSLLKERQAMGERSQSAVVVRQQGDGHISSKYRIAHEILGYLHDHSHQEVDVGTVSEAVNRSASYVSHVFSEVYGKTLIEYLNLIRIEKAKKLLTTCDDTIYNIANRVGYNDEKYFNRIFKKVVGVTPLQYRNY